MHTHALYIKMEDNTVSIISHILLVPTYILIHFLFIFVSIRRNVLIEKIFLSISSPVDHSRVKLKLKTTNQDTDYINANFIKVNVRLLYHVLWHVVYSLVEKFL